MGPITRTGAGLGAIVLTHRGYDPTTRSQRSVLGRSPKTTNFHPIRTGSRACGFVGSRVPTDASGPIQARPITRNAGRHHAGVRTCAHSGTRVVDPDRHPPISRTSSQSRRWRSVSSRDRHQRFLAQHRNSARSSAFRNSSDSPVSTRVAAKVSRKGGHTTRELWLSLSTRRSPVTIYARPCCA
jgi:hypothetical protein